MSNQKSGPLAGVRVVDLSLLLPGPLCSMYLGDMGADVIKVENPRMPDMTRLMGSRITGSRSAETAPTGEQRQGESGLFLMINRNKRAITLNLKRPEGREVFLKLLEDADILLEGFRPDTLSAMGIGFEQLKERFPRLIYCAISGYGADGPYKNLAGHDGNYIAYSGLLGITGLPNGRPVLPGFQVADIGGGTLMALSGILAALYARERTGRGQFVDISMLDGAFSFLSLHAGEYVASGENPAPGRMMLNGGLANYDVYRCKDDRYVMLGTLEERFLRAFLRQVDCEEWLADLDLSMTGVLPLRPKLEQLFASRTRQEWSQLFQNSECCLAPVNSISEAFADPQLRARGMIQEIQHPELGSITVIGSPFHFSDTPCELRRPPPAHGEHTDTILNELGYSSVEIETLRKRRAV